MRNKTKSIKKVLTWGDFQSGLSRAGFSSQESHPDWMYTKGDKDLIIAVPGDGEKKVIPVCYKTKKIKAKTKKGKAVLKIVGIPLDEIKELRRKLL